MKGKKIATLLVSVALGISMLTGCGGKKDQSSETVNAQPTVTQAATPTVAQQASTDPLEMITEGYYTYAYPVEGMGDIYYYFHFYNDDSGIGNVFYAGFAFNQINFAGTYTVEKTPHDYSVAESREKQLNNEVATGTAPYTITFYDWEGNVLDSCGYDGEYLYNDMTKITGIGTENCRYSHDLDGEASKYYEGYQGEVGQVYLSYVSEADASSTVALYHNGTYLDMVNMMVEGKWTMEKTADGYSYSLVPNSTSDTAATLAVASDKATAVYTPEGGTAVSMVNAATAGPKAVMVMKGAAPIPGQDANADLVGNLYDDGTCDLVASAFGQEMPLDQGTYSMGEDGYIVTFQFDKAGEIVSTLGDAGVSIHYIQAGTTIGDLDTDLAISYPE